MAAMDEKLFIGPKLKRLRERKGLSQADLARLSDVSPSYLNQIERNQRPLTASVLLRVSRVLDVALEDLATDDEAQLLVELREALADPLFAADPQPVGNAELRNAIAASPDLGGRFLTLYRRFREMRDARDLGGFPDEPGVRSQGPYEEVRDYFHHMNNYFDGLERAAEALQARENFRLGNMLDDLINYLAHTHGVRTRIDPSSPGGPSTLRRYDPDSRTLTISEALPPASQTFQAAYQIALLDQAESIEQLIGEAGFSAEGAPPICRVGLANHFAGALIMPYREFLNSAEACWYDIEQLQRRFGASFEQVTHRLSTLRRPGAQGVPFYFVRVDKAGNISKRQSAPRFHFARFGGACPLWNVHEAFASPRRILIQLASMPDGTTYLCLARTVQKGGGGFTAPKQDFAVGIGCEISYAHRLVYAQGIDLSGAQNAAVPIGPGCRVCERVQCPQRAFPPATRAVSVDDNRRRFIPYSVAEES